MENDFNNNLLIEDNFDFIEFLSDFNDILNQFWITIVLLIENCEQIKSDASRLKLGTNIVKTVGTGVSALGGVAMVTGVALTPFTFGVSGVLCAGGAAATAVGTAANIGTDITDYVKSRNSKSELKHLAQQRDRSAQELSTKIAVLDLFVAEFLNEEDFNHNRNDFRFEDDINFVRFYTFIGKGVKSTYDLGSNSRKMFESIKEYKALKGVKSVTKVKSAVNLAKTSVKGVGSGISKTTSIATSKLVFKGFSAGVGLIFTVVDAVDLVRDWNQNHPTVEVVEGLIDDLERDLNSVQMLNHFITNTFNSLEV